MMLDIAGFQDAANNGAAMLDARTAVAVSPGDREGFAVTVPGSGRAIGYTLDTMALTAAITESISSVEASDVIVFGWWTPDYGYVIELATVHRVDMSTALLLADLRGNDAVVNLCTGEGIELARIPA